MPVFIIIINKGEAVVDIKNKLISFFKSRKFIVCFVVILFVAMSIIGSIIQWNKYELESKPIYFEVLYYSTQIFSSLFVTGGVIIAVWQYYLSSKSAKTNLELIQVQRAIELSEYYKDNILIYLQPLSYMFEETGITDIIQEIHMEDIQHFDEAELNNLLSKDKIDELGKLTTSKQFYDIFIKANSIYNLGFHIKIGSLMQNDEYTEYGKEVIAAFVSNLFCKILNNMEYFSMHFSHYTADESVVYQSLHQTYLETVHLLFFKIARTNKMSETKYFTNVAWLYKKWIARKIEKGNNFLEGVRNLTMNGTVIENNNIINKK